MCTFSATGVHLHCSHHSEYALLSYRSGHTQCALLSYRSGHAPPLSTGFPGSNFTKGIHAWFSSPTRVKQALLLQFLSTQTHSHPLTKIGPLPGSGSHPYVPCRHQTNTRNCLSVTVAVHQQFASHIEYPDCDDIWELRWDVISSEVKINPIPPSKVLPLKCLSKSTKHFLSSALL